MDQIAGSLEAKLKEKRGDWKSKLSGAFNSEQIFFSLAILSVFYIVYTIFNGLSGVGTNHKGDSFESCYCGHSHQDFYRAWFSIGCIAWCLLLIYTYIGVRFPSFEKLPNLFKDHVRLPTDESGGKSNRNIKVVWFQYYKLFVTGYDKGDNEKIVVNENIHQETPADISYPCLCCVVSVEKANVIRENCDCTYDTQGLGICVSVLKNMSYMLLLVIKFLAQFVTLPLLLLQIFDTHSLLCFSPKLFCATSSESKAHLAQAAISILFYFSLALSQLASTMLSWNPWPQKVGSDSTGSSPTANNGIDNDETPSNDIDNDKGINDIQC